MKQKGSDPFNPLPVMLTGVVGNRVILRLGTTQLARKPHSDLTNSDGARTACRMLKRPSGEAAASEEARRTLRYVEPLSDARTKLADFLSVLLGRNEFHSRADESGSVVEPKRLSRAEAVTLLLGSERFMAEDG